MVSVIDVKTRITATADASGRHSNGIQTFPSQSPFGFNGRSLYARLAWTF
jgi:hypothetical protein